MLLYNDLARMASEKTGVNFAGIETKTAKIRNRHGRSLRDVLGWEVTMKSEDGDCYEYYVAQPPLLGMTLPVPVSCRIGVVPFDGYKIDIADAIKIYQSGQWGEEFTDIVLSWPFTYPLSDEPYWYFRSVSGNIVIIGAISGQIKNYHSPFRMMYAAPHVGGPVAALYRAPDEEAQSNLLYGAIQEAERVVPLYMAQQEGGRLYEAPQEPGTIAPLYMAQQEGGRLYEAPQEPGTIAPLYMAQQEGGRLYEAPQEPGIIAPLYMAQQGDEPIQPLYAAPNEPNE